MLRSRVSRAIGVAALFFALSPVAHATDVATVWQAGGCLSGYELTPVNGVDSHVIRVDEYAGQYVVVQWQAAAAAAGTIKAEIVDANCKIIGSNVVGGGTGVNLRGSFPLRIPATAKWVVVHHPGFVGFETAAG